MNKIKLAKSKELTKYLSKINPIEMDDEVYDAVKDNKSGVLAIFLDKEIIGFSYLQYDKKSGFVFIYIFSEYRHLGYGKEALLLSEKKMKASSLEEVITSYPCGNGLAKEFAEKYGYHYFFSSAYMTYQGDKFDLPDLPIRKYEDKDFIPAFVLAEEAFHIMRIETGHFPDSKIKEPNEESRKRHLKNKDDEYVYIYDNEVVGFASLYKSCIDSISIKVSHQGKGLGTNFVKYLVNQIIDKEKEIPSLWCVVGNKKARALYDSLGFKEQCIISLARKRK